MLLVIEIGAGVLLGLLAYRGIDSYCTKRNLTLTAAILWNLRRLLVWTALFAFVAGIGFLFYYYILSGHIHISQYQFLAGCAILLGLSLALALRTELKEGRKYKVVAAKTACDKCGKMNLKFTSYRSGVGAYDHPRAKCSGCDHEQMLSSLT